MPLKKEVELRPAQRAAVDKLVSRDGSLIFSHPVGSGKTITSIAGFEALRQHGKAHRALAVTPASLRENFGENGVKKYTTDDYVMYGTDDTDIDKVKDPPTYGIVSYEMFRKNPEKYIKGHKADTVIFDEIHKIKNEGSITYEKLKESRPLYRNFIGLTGSVVSNTPADIVPLVDALTNGNHGLGTKASFENRFVEEGKNRSKRLINPARVASMLAPYIHHVAPESLDTKLPTPKKIVNTIEVPMSEHQSELYRYVMDQLDPITKAKLRLSVGKLAKTDLSAVFAKLIKARQVSNSIATMDKNITLATSAVETPKVRKLLDDLVEHHKNVPDAQTIVHSNLINGGIDVLEAGLKDLNIPYSKFIGKGNEGMTDEVRSKAVEDFNNKKTRVMLISSAGAEGLNLPDTTQFLSLDGHYNPERIFQAEARGIRAGGQSNRPVKDRQVIVNRYVSTIPRVKTELAYDTAKALNPMTYIDRFMNNEKIFRNPLARKRSVDEIMYDIAKNKNTVNQALRDNFMQKSSGFFYKDRKIVSDIPIMNRYIDRFKDELDTGDYGVDSTKMIDPREEGKYLSELRDYYALASSPSSSFITPKKFNKATRLKLALAGAATGAGAATALTLPLLPRILSFAQGPLNRRKYDISKIIAGTLVLSSLAGAASGAHTVMNKDFVTTPLQKAKKRVKFTDQQLLALLRGNVVSELKTKKTDHYI